MNTLIKKFIDTQRKKEKKISIHKRKQNGTFLTNELKVVDKIIDIISIDENLFEKKILEPAVGQGILIIRLLDIIVKIYTNKQKISFFIEKNIFFIDIDNQMIEETKKNISQWFYNVFKENYKGKFNSFILDFTKKNNTSYLFKTENYILKDYISYFDYIIGNPPYVSLYGKQDKKQNEKQRIFYLQNYEQFPNYLKNGKINYVMLFLEHGLNLLKENGKLSYIIDLSFFETAYQYTRKYLLENTNILSIIHNIKEFDVASGQVILKLEKQKNKEHEVKIINEKNQETTKLKQQIWNNKKDEYKFRFLLDEHSTNILNKIKTANNKTLKELHPAKNLRTCVMLLNMEDKFIFKENNLHQNLKTYPYYQGSKGLSEKYTALKHQKYFYYNKQLQDKINEQLKEDLAKKDVKNKKRLGLGETIIYDNPKVFIRQSAKKLIASYTENPSASNNSLYVFSLRNNSEKTKRILKFICGIINAELFTFWAQKMNIIRYAKGKQPQIKISDLYTLPILQDIEVQNKLLKM